MLVIENMSQSFAERVIYKDVSIRINKGDKIGLVGANGSGKSTLINILNGTILCDKGNIKWEGKHKVGYLDQYASVDESLTIYEYLEGAFSELKEIEEKFNKVNESMAYATSDEELIRLSEQSGKLYDRLEEGNYYAIPSTINKVASGLGVTGFGLDTSLSKLSGGQRAKVMLVKLLLEQPSLIILDEPTNFLDVTHVEWLTRYLIDYKGTFLIVSHNTDFLNKVVNCIWDVHNLTITRYSGNYESFLEQREMKLMQADKLREAQEKTVDKLKDYIARNKARAATARMAKSREKQLAKIEIMEKAEPLPIPQFKFAYKPLIAKQIITVKDLTIGYNRPLIKNINFAVQNGEKLRIKGFNGIGKTTLLKTLCDIIPSLAGDIELNRNLVIGYYEQDHNFNNEDITAVSEIYNTFPKLSEREIRGYLARAGLTAKHLQQPIKNLSGGEQSKIKLCKLMIKQHNVLLLDEPTNHLDVAAKEVLVKAINEFPGSVIYVTHENDFADKINSRELDIESLLNN